jgi:hypothetical protein
LAGAYKKSSIQLGLSIGRSKQFSEVFKDSVAQVAKFGGSIDDVREVYQEFNKESGRSRIINPEDVTNIVKLQKATNLMGSEAAEMYETFDLMGKSLADVNKEMETLIMDSQKIGLNSREVIKVLGDNIGRMQTFSFANGVKGMTEMAKQAVRMRVDVSDVLTMADKFYQPEAAIEAASKLQLLGGDIASAFGDPFTIMYEARNKPEELAKRVQKMTENMIQFNEETGEYELPAEARMQFQALGDAIGIGSDKLIEMSRQTAKMKDIRMELSGTDLFSEEQMEGIANMARMTDDGFKVDLIGDDGKMIEKNIRDLTSGEVEMLLKPPPTQEELMKKEDKYMDQMIYNSQTTNERLERIQDSFEKFFVADIDVYKLMEKATEEQIKTFSEFGGNLSERALNKLGDNEITKLLSSGIEGGIESLNTATKNLTDGLLKFFDDKPISEMNVTNLNFDKLGNMLPIESDKDPQTLGGKDPTGEKVGDFLSRNDGTVTSFSSMDDVIGAKSGGPIDKLLNSVLPNKQTSVVEVKGNPKIDININSNNPNMNFTTEQMDQITSVALSSILSVFNNGGSVDGGSQSQNAKGFEQKLGKFG